LFVLTGIQSLRYDCIVTRIGFIAFLGDAITERVNRGLNFKVLKKVAGLCPLPFLFDVPKH